MTRPTRDDFDALLCVTVRNLIKLMVGCINTNSNSGFLTRSPTYKMIRPQLALSRTSSSNSFSSEDDGASMSSSTVTISTSRRTRKRFTNTQLIMLENLFHQNSHPSREDREAVAKAGGMYVVFSFFLLRCRVQRSPDNRRPLSDITGK